MFGFFGRGGSGVHRDADVGLLSAGASLVPSPAMLTSLPLVARP